MPRHPDADPRILDAAERLLARGELDFSMDQLAAEAEVSRATLYRRFTSRDALLQHLARERGIDVGAHDRPNVRTRILLAARAVFGRVGLPRATIEQIALEAGVGPATVYRQFGTKEGLWDAFAREHSPRKAARELLEPGTGDLEHDLAAFALEVLKFADGHADLVRLSFFSEGAMSDAMESIRQAPGRTTNSVVRYLEAQMASGRLARADSLELAIAFTGMLFAFGVMGPSFHGRKLEDPEHIALFIARLFLDGVRRQGVDPHTAAQRTAERSTEGSADQHPGNQHHGG